jgi:hypothetical protein
MSFSVLSEVRTQSISRPADRRQQQESGPPSISSSNHDAG